MNVIDERNDHKKGAAGMASTSAACTQTIQTVLRVQSASPTL
ncbi:MAG TPA: hypothetical protein VF393_04900 [archaeon]